MDSQRRVSAEALEAVLAKSPTRPPRVIVGATAHAAGRLVCASAKVVADADLPKLIREHKRGPAVVAVEQLSTNLTRALRERPPALLVLGSALADEEHEAFARHGTLILGPDARLCVGRGRGIVCATRRDALERLLAALDPPCLAISPAPAWLVSWLDDPALHGHELRGYIDARVLDAAWHDWARRAPAMHVLVPLGVATSALEQPFDPALEAIAAAHALERWTGPVFPAPTVIAALGNALAKTRQTQPEHEGEDALAMWSQARRALPFAGQALGMDSPDPQLGLARPTSAFLAQRALLRARQASALVERRAADPNVQDDDEVAVQRSLEVLQNAAEMLTDHESKVVLRGVGIDITRQAVANSASGAVQFADRIGYPVVLKAVSPDLRRKQEIGAIVLDLGNAAAVRRAYGNIEYNVQQRAPTIRLDGVVVAEMLEPGLDLRCGALRSKCGRSAFYGYACMTPASVEPVLALGPLSPEDALLLAEAILARVPLPALRRASDPAVDHLAALFQRLDKLILASDPRLLVVDLNPVRLVAKRGCVVVDARIRQRAHLEGT